MKKILNSYKSYIVILVLFFSPVFLIANSTCTHTMEFTDNNGIKHEILVTMHIDNNPYECGEVSCSVNLIILSGGDVNFQSGEFYYHEPGDPIDVGYNGYISLTSDKVNFFFPLNGIYSIAFKLIVNTTNNGGDFAETFYCDATIPICANVNKCTSSFSYCDVYNNVEDSDEQMPMIEYFIYSDPDYGLQVISKNNNPHGIFRFPYVARKPVQCYWPPNIHTDLYDFTNDLNKYLSLDQWGNSAPGEENLSGTAVWYQPKIDAGNSLGLCKTYLRILNSKVFVVTIVREKNKQIKKNII